MADVTQRDREALDPELQKIVDDVCGKFRADMEAIVAKRPPKRGDLTTEQQCELVADANIWRSRALSAEAAARHRTADAARTFQLGQRVRKTKGSCWQGRVVGFYSTSLTPEGYAVESEREPGSVQIYPVNALEAIGGQS